MTFPGSTTYPGAATFPAVPFVSPTNPTPAVVTLNGLVLSDIDAFGVDWSTWQVDGWDGSPASSLALTQKTRAAGAWTSPRNLAARSLGALGRFVAPDVDSAVAAIDRLNAAARLNGGTLSVQRGSQSRSCTVYRQGEVLLTEETATMYQWTVNLVAPDPRKFGTKVAASTGLPSSSGGLAIPFTIPFTIASTVVSGRCVLTNPGNATGPVTLRIDGPVVGPQIVHITSGLTLTFGSSLTINSGEWLTVDMEAQTALLNDQASRNNGITNRGWFGFSPGANEFDFSAVSGSGQLTVTATPTWQ
jgi:hypothetical protein